MKVSRFLRMACAIAALAVAVCALPACNDTGDVNINNTPVEQQSEPVPKGQMTLFDLMMIMSETMAWSDIRDYDHTLVTDTNAVFEVSDEKGNLCTLDVTFDAAADTISKADLTYGDLTLSALTESTSVVRDIMVAIRLATEQPTE